MLKSIKWDGTPITKPGMYAGVPLTIYHSQQICPGPSVSSSGLRRILEENNGSPADFYCEWSGNPNRIEPDETKEHFVLGRAVHHLILGQPFFTREFVLRPEEVRDRKTGLMKAWHSNRDDCKSWLAANVKGRTVLTTAQVEHIKGMAMALGAHPLMPDILRGKIERSIIWKDKETGLWIKVRPDAIPTDSGDFCDLKTTTSVQWLDLMRSMTDFAYHQQAALTREAARLVLGIDMTTFSFMFVQKKPPYSVRRVQAKPEDIELGHKQNVKARRIVAECIAKKRWPGPGGDDDVGGHIDIFDKYRERAKESVK